MPPDESNEFFDHLNRPANRRPSSHNQQRPEDFSQISDPFAEEGDSGEHEQQAEFPQSSPTLQARGRERIRQSQQIQRPKGPGLSPGIPQQRERKPTQQVQQSGVVLTPGGVKRVDEEPPPAPKAKARRVKSQPVDIPAEEEEDFYEQSRKKSDDGDVGWEEYAASDFPAMEAEEFGVKVGTTQSGRIVPVGVRKDLTDEALKNQSIKAGGKGGGRRPRPAKTKKQQAPEAPRSFMQKIGDSLRLTKPVFDEDEPETQKSSSKGGFQRSGSIPSNSRAKQKKTPLGIAWSIFVEVVKIFMLVLLLRAYVVQVSQVQGPSMQPTLEEEDRLIVERVTPILANNDDKWWISWMPEFITPEYERGDIVVVRSPEDPGSELVKRLIALPGDTVKFEDGNLYRKNAGASDFEQVQEDYLNNEELKREDGSYRSYRDAGDLGGIVEGEEILVPQDRIFVLGDNRAHSNDSRRWLEIDVNRTEPSGIDQLWLHRSSIEGRVVFRIYPFGRMWPPVK